MAASASTETEGAADPAWLLRWNLQQSEWHLARLRWDHDEARRYVVRAEAFLVRAEAVAEAEDAAGSDRLPESRRVRAWTKYFDRHRASSTTLAGAIVVAEADLVRSRAQLEQAYASTGRGAASVLAMSAAAAAVAAAEVGVARVQYDFDAMAARVGAPQGEQEAVLEAARRAVRDGVDVGLHGYLLPVSGPYWVQGQRG